MATQTRTKKSVSRKRHVKRSRLSKKMDKVVQRFQFWSTLGFWGGLSLFALTHGWLPVIVTFLSK